MNVPKLPAEVKPWIPLGVGIVVVALLVGVVAGRFMPDATTTPAEPSASGDGHQHGSPDGDSAAEPDMVGLSLSSAGHTLVPGDTTVTANDKARQWTFTITNTQGEPVTDFATVHGKKMHLFAMKRDLSRYQHLHPEMDSKGSWQTDIAFDSPGSWRVITDFAAGAGEKSTALTLGTDVTVPGDNEPHSLPKPRETVSTDGFDVELDFSPKLSVASPALVSVTRDGRAAQLRPYLGARGHLVILRQHDLGFAHVHPDPEDVDQKLRFWATLPSAGTYRAFLDFKVGKTVHTAAFTIKV